MILLSPVAGIAQAAPATTSTPPDRDASAPSEEPTAPVRAARRAEATLVARRAGDAMTGDPADPPPQRSGASLG